MIKILLVDDLASICEIFRDSLTVESDFEIVGTAENGFEAILKVEPLVPDVVLMDVEMPKMDGIEATRILSQRGFRAKVLILTSHEREEYFERATQAGAKG
jgi:DNA-binding NarL/FixJ family response regulator